MSRIIIKDNNDMWWDIPTERKEEFERWIKITYIQGLNIPSYAIHIPKGDLNEYFR